MSATTETKARDDQLEERVEELEAKLEEKDEQIKEQAQRIDQLEAELKEYRERNERDKAKVKRRVTDLEQQPEEQEKEDAREDLDTEEEEQDRGRTPLDQVVSLPEHVAQQELTENQDRARFIAKDVLDYATKVPAGFVVTSSDIRTILAAKEDGTPHTETVSRVMNFLDGFGQDEIEIVKRHGKRRVVFTEEAATRYHNADARDQEEITGVVMGRATG